MSQGGRRKKKIEWADDLASGFQIMTDLAATIGNVQCHIETPEGMKKAVDCLAALRSRLRRPPSARQHAEANSQ